MAPARPLLELGRRWRSSKRNVIPPMRLSSAPAFAKRYGKKRINEVAQSPAGASPEMSIPITLSYLAPCSENRVVVSSGASAK